MEPGRPRQLWVRRRDLGQARRGRWEPAWRRAIGRLWGRRSRWALADCVCRPGGGPLGDAGNSPGAYSLHLRQPRWQPDGRTEAHVFFSFYEGSPWPSLPFWDWSGCVYWSWGSADHPAPGKAFVLFRRDVSLQNRRPLGASVSPSVDWGYNFSWRSAVRENERRWQSQCGEKG